LADRRGCAAAAAAARQKRVLNCKLIAAAAKSYLTCRAAVQQLMNTIQYSHQMEVNLNKLERLRNMQSGIIIMSLGEKSIVAAAATPQKARAERVICGAKSGIPDEPL
jgi:hypothetical protein